MIQGEAFAIGTVVYYQRNDDWQPARVIDKRGAKLLLGSIDGRYRFWRDLRYCRTGFSRPLIESNHQQDDQVERERSPSPVEMPVEMAG
jgi:hypothetical protein